MARPTFESIWRFSDQLIDADTENLYVARRAPFRFVDEGVDAIVFISQQGDFLEFYCQNVYEGAVEFPHRLWRQVADFQQEPIQDPFTPLEEGRRIVLPSISLMTNTILNERTRVAEL